MNILAIDVSSQNTSLCLECAGQVKFNFNRRLKFGASKLINFMAKALKKSSLDLKDIDIFVVGQGPGSFTGLRISFSLIKAFMLGLKKPVYPVGSFFACAYPYRHKYEKIAVIADARKDLVYLASFKSQNGILKKNGRERLINTKELLQQKGDYFFVTPDPDLRSKILALNPKLNFCRQDVYPKTKYLIAAIEMLKIPRVTSPADLKPLYLHPKTCQIRKSCKL